MTRIVFMGTPEFAVASLAALGAGPYEVVGVLTREDQPIGRGQRLGQSPVKRYALAHGLPVVQPVSLRSASAQECLAQLRPDLIVVAAYGLLLPQPVLDLPPLGCINVHGSLLPRHRGAAPIAAAILAGDAVTGITIMQMEAGLDTGPILSAAAIPILAEDTTGTLTEKLASLGAELLVRTLPSWLRGELKPAPQPEEGATFSPRITKADGKIDWTESAGLLARKVRAYQPWPTAYTAWNGQLLRVLQARADPTGEVDRLPGAVISQVRGTAGVVTGQGVLWLELVQPAGKKAMPIAAFMAGARGFVGSVLA